MADEPQETIKNILNATEISLILDTYDDIFSDFDPRPYNERSLSEDFLAEAKRAARDKGVNLELRFLVPNSARNTQQEERIKHRLRAHFKSHYNQITGEIAAYRKQAMILIIIGTIIGLVEAFILSSSNSFGLDTLFTGLGIVLTPASWFSIWTGVEHLVYTPKDMISDEAFYKKMETVKITFTSY